MDDKLRALLAEAACIQAHIDNDRIAAQEYWNSERQRCFAEIAEYFNTEIYDGPEDAS